MIGEKHTGQWLLQIPTRLCLAVAASMLLAILPDAKAGNIGWPDPFTLTADQPPPSGDVEAAVPETRVPDRNGSEGSSEDETESYSEPEDPGFGGCLFDRRPLELMV